MEVQSIGVDLGRGYVKGYTEFNGKVKTCLFQSIVGDSRKLEDYSSYKDPIYLKVDDESYFVGELAEKESYNPISNFSDSKTTDIAKKLLYALFSKLAESNYVKICIGVPNKTFNNSTRNKIKNEYVARHLKIFDEINGTTKDVTIVKADIFREADAALFHEINVHPELKNEHLGTVIVGFRTTEESYFDTGMKFNDKLSSTIEVGNRTVLDIIQKNLLRKNISKSLNEIDSSKEYNKLKDIGYKNLLERINQDMEMRWINYSEMHIFLGGGTSKNFNVDFIPDKFEMIEDPQMAVSKGLYFIAKNL